MYYLINKGGFMIILECGEEVICIIEKIRVIYIWEYKYEEEVDE